MEVMKVIQVIQVIQVMHQPASAGSEMDCQPPRHCKQQGKNNAVVNNNEKTMPLQREK
jgi:hypothetical protein